ncbi:MAG: TRAP transporter fused permease subunit [Rhodospirillales bacterium]|nr:TRAP transporter fused permease subunit [Rhodospirillales bacterium]
MSLGKRLIDVFFSVGCRRHPTGLVAWAILPFAILIAIWVIYAALFAIIDPLAHSIVFACGMLALLFLICGPTENSDRSKPHWTDWPMSALSLASGVYFFLHVKEIAVRITLLDPLTSADLFFGTAIFLLTIEATRRATGLGLTLIVLIFITYNLFGHHLGGVLGHGYISFTHFLDVMMFTTDGVFGVAVRVAATYAFLFVMFGTILERAGGARFFFDIAAVFTGRHAGGPAKIAVISSGLYGMISGSPTADVVTTGSVTIPVMKRLGISNTQAGGIEVAASTGGSIMPPVMGSAAFIMAEYTGIPYRDIAIAAFLPAILYYVGVYSQVHFHAVRKGLVGLPEDQIPGLAPTLRSGGVFLVPLAVLIVALLMGYSPNMVAVMAAISVVVVASLRKETRMGPKAIVMALADSTMLMVTVTAACAAAGLVVGGISMTGLAAKFSHLIHLLAGANMLPSLIVIAALSLLLGMGMPTPNVYILTAVLVGPLLAQLGVDKMAGNLFLVYFAALSAMTPPVAVAAYAAAPIADANPLKVGFAAVKLTLAAFIVPFAFIYGTELLLRGPVWLIAFSFGTAFVGVVLLAAALEGWFRGPLSPLPRLIIAAAALAFIVPGIAAAAIGVGLAVAAFMLNRILIRNPQTS